MSKENRLVAKIRNYFSQHKQSRLVVDFLLTLLMSATSGFVYAVGFRLFISPVSTSAINFVAGGLSGLAQTIAKIVVDLLGVNINRFTFQSILYLTLNIPVLIFAWFKVTKRFAFFTLVNVSLTSLFIAIIPNSWSDFVMLDSQLTRALLAGIAAGLCASLAFVSDHSAGGIDVFTYYFANRKSTNVGRYAILLNTFVMTSYTIISLIENYTNPAAYQQIVDVSGTPIFDNPIAPAITPLLYSVVYLFMSAIVIDLINIRNKKTQLQIITSNKELSKELIAHFNHGCTIVNGEGAYTGAAKLVLYMTVSSSEVRRAVRLIQAIDEHAFINVTPIHQVYGRFYIKPVR